MKPVTLTEKIKFVEERASVLLKCATAAAPDNAATLARVFEDITCTLAEIQTMGTEPCRRRTGHEEGHVELNERKQAEQALRESEMRFRTLVEQSPLSTQIMTPDGKTVQVNRAWEQLWGVTLDRIPEYNMLEDQQLVAKGIMPYIRRGFAGNATEVPAVDYDPDASIPNRSSHPDPRRWVRAFIYPVKDEAGNIQQVVLVHEDITEQLQDKARLQESESRFRQLAEHITEVFWMFDAGTLEMLYISPAYEQIWARTRESLIAHPRSFTEAIHPADRERVHASLERQLRGEQTLIEYRVLQPDGTVRWVQDRGFPIKDASGRVYRVAGLAEDITERKQAEEALRESEERYRWLVELSPETIGVHSEGKIVYINHAGIQLFGASSAAELIGKPMLDMVHPTFREAIITCTRMTHEPGQAVDLLEGKFIRLDGTAIDVEVAAIPATWQGKPAAQVVVRDITARKRSEEERTQLLLREQEARAEAEAAIVVRDEFLSIAAHELKTPVTALLAYTQVMERRAERDQSLGQRDRRTLRVLAEQAERLSRLIRSLLDISRIQTGIFSLERSPLDLCTLARRVTEDVQMTTDRHLIELVCPATAVTIEGDDLRLEQMLQNLLQNAIKYSPAGGPIVVQLQQDDTFAMLSVSDHGIGIPQEAYSRLFQRYYRAGNSAGAVIGGMGLGLYVVKELVERHHGSIEVISAEGQGSTFIVRLPLLSPDRT